MINIINNEKKIDKYDKNLIRFNDEVNNIKSERKRKNINKISIGKEERKGAQSLYTCVNPLNIENRNRIESNYTTRSGDKLVAENEFGCSRSLSKQKVQREKSNVGNRKELHTDIKNSEIKSISPLKKGYVNNSNSNTI